jgi:hypothetical protein
MASDILLILVVMAVIAGALALAGRRRRSRDERWHVRLRSVEGCTAVEIVRPGERPLRVALLDPADEEFSSRLEDARATAMDRAVALNSVQDSLNP